MTIITHADLPTTGTYISKSRQHRFVNAATGAKSSTIVEELIPPGDFVRTTNGRSILEEGEEDFLRFLAAEIAARGRIEVSHDYGLFIARK